MADVPENKRQVRVFRYDPTVGGGGHFDRFEVVIKDEQVTTILDVLLTIQKEQDPSLSFRFACRVSMCGSCGMVINGRERLACKTVVKDLPEPEITIRPFNNLPVQKDLVVDMEPFFNQYAAAMPYFHPAEDTDEPAIIPPDTRERKVIGLATECIACGCCVSSCSMVNNHPDYCGPAAINRAFTLLADSRDGLREQRLERVLGSCFNCRTELNCTDVCPKELSPTRAIKYIQQHACLDALSRKSAPRITPAAASIPPAESPPPARVSRRDFLKRITYGAGTATTAVVGTVLVSAAVGPSLRTTPTQWVRVGLEEKFRPDRVETVTLRYTVQDGIYKTRRVAPVLVVREGNTSRLRVFNSRCTHLGCTVHWDEGRQLFLCACHGGTFDPDGSVKTGPPPRPLDRLGYKITDGSLFVEVV